MATTDAGTPVILRTDVLDMDLIHVLEKQYTVILDKRDNDLIIELHKR